MDKKFNKRLIFIAAAAVLAVIAAIFFIFMRKDTAGSVQEHLELGQKYLVELDYSNAVLEFTDAINIDPKNPDAYIGLAEAYIGTGDTEKAIETLEKGYEETGDERIKKMLDELTGSSDTENDTEETTVTEEVTLPAETEVSETTVTTEAEAPETVPDFTGMKTGEAVSQCGVLGINYEIKTAVNAGGETGTVISQSVKAGTEITDGMQIVLVVCGQKQADETVVTTVTTAVTSETTVTNAETSAPITTAAVKTENKTQDKKYIVEPVSVEEKRRIVKADWVKYPYVCRHYDDSMYPSVVAEEGEDVLPDYTNDNTYSGGQYYSIENKNKSIKLSSDYTYVAQFSEGLAFFERIVENNKKYKKYIRGYLDSDGKEVFGYEYVDTRWVGSNGSGNSLGFIDDSKPLYKENHTDMHYGYAAYQTEYDGKYGIIDSEGNVVVKPKYDSVVSVGNDIIRVGLKQETSYDQDSDVVAVTVSSDKYGYITAKGKKLIDCKYDSAGDFINGFAVVGVKEENSNNYNTIKKGVINRKGKTIIQPEYDYVLIENNGFIITFNYDRKREFYLFDMNGNQVFDEAYPYILTGAKNCFGSNDEEANDRIVVQKNDGKIYLYDLNCNLIGSTEGEIIDLYAYMDISISFDPTEILPFYVDSENSIVKFMDKQGNVYSEHPYGLGVCTANIKDNLYSTCDDFDEMIKRYYTITNAEGN